MSSIHNQILLTLLVLGIFVVCCQSQPQPHAKPKPLENAVEECNPKAVFPSLKAICALTMHPDSCYDTINPLINSSRTIITPEIAYHLSIKLAIDEVIRASKYFSENGKFPTTYENLLNKLSTLSALEVCQDVASLSVYNLNTSIHSGADLTKIETIENIRTWLSAAGSDLGTCLDSFENEPVQLRKAMERRLNKSNMLISNTLSFATIIRKNCTNTNGKKKMSRWAPSWLSPEVKKLISQASNATIPNLVVAQDGSGNFKTINEALNAVPSHSKARFVIHVKAGVYYENVRVEKKKINVMMFGDGLDKTIVSANLSWSVGRKTFQTATFAVFGSGFIARDMGFRNTAGPTKGQAVALLSSADESVFYRCRIDAYQDTLYTHSNHQFYRECDIYGTIDFIFGHSSVVIQECNILVRKPLPGQYNTITAQGKECPNKNSGITIQNCIVKPAENLDGVRTFLGRPWKNYSTTVFMQNNLGSLIDPKGWHPWFDASVPPDTIFYAEYENAGPGAVTTDRVKWKGLMLNLSAEQVSMFTVRQFIDQKVQWLPATGVPFEPDL